jgi:FkbM family methyltransferase
VKLAGKTREALRRIGYDVRRFRSRVVDPFAAQIFLLRDVPCRVIFDVGAYQGDAAARYAHAFPQAEIYAFEPFPPTYERLTRRFADEPQIHTINRAVSSTAGSAVFHVNGLAATNSLLQRPVSGRRYFPREAATIETITVSTTTLDEFCKDKKIEAPDILKLDIQGNELAALRGADETLQTGKIGLIFTEVTFVPHYEGGVLFNELCTHLNERGYTLFNFYDMYWAEIGQLRFGDALFINNQLRHAVVDRLPEE